MSRRTLIVFASLLTLALLPVTLSFVLTGENEDVVAEAEEPAVTEPAVAAPSGKKATVKRAEVPVFKSYEDPRYQKYDALISRFVSDYNKNRAKWAGSTSAQAEKMPDITVAQVKAHMIQETGGGDVQSRAAWAKDPLQVNVPGDWNAYKQYLGLRKPRHRNEGSLEKNLRAGIMLLARKGFGVSGQPASNRPEGGFDGWRVALQRYNGRSDKAADGRAYREAYAERILLRAKNPARETPIPIPTKRGRK